MTAIRGAGGGGGGGCFLGHTLIATPTGERRIDELQPGDLVWSFDHNGKIHAAAVLKVHEHHNEPVTSYTLWGGQILDATPNHWVLNQFNAFVEIDTLGTDDCLIDHNGHLRPIISKTDAGTGTVYNLTVEGHHTFIAAGIRVHNAGLGLGIAGAGGGGGGGKGGGGGQAYVPIEKSDNIKSTQFASVLDLLSEGEIQGLDDGEKSIFLDDTPVKSAAGTANFSGYTITTRTGTQNQSYITNLNGTESEEPVGVTITKATPVIRTITDVDVDRVRVTLQLPSLQRFTDKGDVLGSSVQIKISVQYNGGGFTVVRDDTIKGKTSNAYQRDYIVALSGAFPVDIKVERVTDDPTTTKTQNIINWSSYTEIIDEKLRYPNSALAFLRFDAKNFNSIPTRKYLIRGIKVRLPSNATVDTTTHLGRVTYAGVWDGTFGAATWCNDPAWCLWDLLTNTRYGAAIPESSLDRYDFFAISQYCNVLVSNGFGGQEPRFSCNLLLNSRDEVFNVIQEFTTLFRGIVYYGAGSMVLLQDKPSDSQYILGPANVVGGVFTYSGTSQKTRHTTATVAYQTYAGLGEVEYEYVEDANAVAKYGVINKDLKMLGCYSRGQAHRAGKWALLSEQNLTETVTFAVSIDSGIVLRPGTVFDVADPTRAGTRRMGRISAATSTTVTVDDASVSINLSNAPTISVIMPTGLVETRTITARSGALITVGTAFSEAPNAQSSWLIQTNDIQSQKYRTISVTEGEDGTFGVSALAYNESIYNAIESDIELVFRDITNLSITPDPPTAVTGNEYLYEDGQNVFTAFELSWNPPTQGVKPLFYKIEYRLGDDNWLTVQPSTPSVTLRNLSAGKLDVNLQSVTSVDKSSTVTNASFTLIGKTAIPGNVENLTFEVINANSGRLKWTQTVDLDVKVGGKVHVRHSSLTDGSATWSNSVDLIAAVAGSATQATIPLVEGEVLVKFADDLGNQSASETSVIIDLPDTLGPLIVLQQREDQETPPFQGTKTNCFYSDEFDALVIDGSTSFDSVTDVDAMVTFDVIGDVLSSAQYDFANVVDLGSVFSLDLVRYFVTHGFFPSDLIDSRTNDVDSWSDFDGGVVDKVNASVEVRTTNDNPAGTPTWSAYQKFDNGTYKGRGFEFRAKMTSSAIDQNIRIDELGFNASLQKRVEQSDGAIASGTSALTITFANAFFTGTASLGGLNAYMPSIGITGQNMQSGDYFTVTAVTSTSFTVQFFNSANVGVTRNFNWSAVGYGKTG